MAGIEVPTGPWIHMLPGSRSTSLLHSGTGEHVFLDHRAAIGVSEAEAHLLLLDANGDQRGDVEPEWVCESDLFRSTLFLDASGSHYISDDGGKTEWRDEAFVCDTVSKVLMLSHEGNSYGLQVFHSRFPRGVARVRFSVPYVMHWVFMSRFNAKWFGRRQSMFSGYISKSGLGDGHWVSSTASIAMRARLHSASLDEVCLANSDDEFSCSTQGFLNLLLHLMLSQFQEVEAGHLDRVCRGLLESFVNYFVPEDAFFRFVVNIETKLYCIVVGRNVSFLTEGGPHSGLAWPRGDFVSPMPLVDCLLRLVDSIRRPSKCTHHADSKAALLTLLDMVAGDVEQSKDNELYWKCEWTHLLLPSLGSEFRARRVSGTSKSQLSRAVASEPTLRKASQLMAAQRLLTGGIAARGDGKGRLKRKRVGALAKPTSTGSWSFHNSRQYLYHTRRTFKHTKILGLIIDGTGVGTKDALVGIGCDPETGRAGFAPTQEPYGALSACHRSHLRPI
jgi:hypothetical protein